MKFIILDIQGFKIEKNKFFAKELAAFDGTKICHYIFKSPFHMKYLPPDLHKQAVWLMRNHHCIPWSEGYTPIHKFSEIIKDLTENVDNVYVKGREKSEYIRKYSLNPVIELDEDPPLISKKPSCFYHSKSPCICALTNVYTLYNDTIMIE